MKPYLAHPSKPLLVISSLAAAAIVSAACAGATGPEAKPSGGAAKPATAGGAGSTGIAATIPFGASSTRVAYGWGWPGPGKAATINHRYTQAKPPWPPWPYLVSISKGAYRGYDQMSFTWQGKSFPSYTIEYVPRLHQDASGKRIPMPGAQKILRIVFQQAQAHDLKGRPTIRSKPPAKVGYRVIKIYKPAGDFEGYVTYGIGIKPVAGHPRTRVRVMEETRTQAGRKHYVISVQFEKR